MTLKSNASMADLYAMRQSGATMAQLAEASGLKPITAYQRLRREFGLSERMPGPANDNNPLRATRMTPRNGGCSTVSGMMPVTVARVPSVDGKVAA